MSLFCWLFGHKYIPLNIDVELQTNLPGLIQRIELMGCERCNGVFGRKHLIYKKQVLEEKK